MSRIEQHQEPSSEHEQHPWQDAPWSDQRRVVHDLGDSPLAVRWSRC